MRKISPTQLAGLIDHTLLYPAATREEIKRLCGEAARYGFKTVCVNPVYVANACRFLSGTGVSVCSVAGFPLGAQLPATKAHETEEVVKLGATEVDMVIWVGGLKERRRRKVLEDIRAVVDAATGAPVKVILETCYLTDEEKKTACMLAREAGAAFVKTSTGLAAGGARAEDVRLMRDTVGAEFGVKAAGGIGSLADALRMIEAGANRLGMSGSVSIMAELEGSTGT